jgi:hypothetical protein
MKPSSVLAWILLVNTLLAISFVYINFSIWDNMNRQDLISGNWNPFTISFVGKAVVNNELPLATDGLFINPNYPFWLFFLSTTVNLFFIFKLQRSKEKK